jgi:hypothetical protein
MIIQTHLAGFKINSCILIPYLRDILQFELTVVYQGLMNFLKIMIRCFLCPFERQKDLLSEATS